MPKVVLFSRGSQDGESTADDWDDTELLKEYDEAVRPLKALVAERMGLSNAELEEASASESCASASKVGEKNNKRNQRKRRKKNKNKQREWAVGDHCSAMYTVDGVWYEATIISVDPQHSTCVVQYVGYGNVEEQPLSAIAQSMGVGMRRKQSQAATQEKDSEAEGNQSDEVNECSSQASSSASAAKHQSSVGKTKQNASGKFFHNHHSPQGSGPRAFQPPNFKITSGCRSPNIPKFPSYPHPSEMVPPPLPPHILSGLPEDDSEALSAMLMSWYMSGFHTGYYQAMKSVKSPSHR